MQNKHYIIADDAPQIACEPAVAYNTAPFQHYTQEREYKSSDRWNPNVPFHGTQEEWWEHFHRIEDGTFYPVSETHQRISKWLQEQKR